MKQRAYLVLIVVVLSACNPVTREETKEERSQQISQSAPDTSSWPALLDRTRGITYRAGHTVCAGLAKPYKTKDNTEQDVIVNNAVNNKDNPMYYRYTVPLKAPSLIKKQLELFHKAGFLEVDNVTHEGQQVLAYRLTNRGWGEAPINNDFLHSLCYETGKWRTSKILDYSLLDDQGSGLEAYQVKFETEYQLKGWVNSDLLKAFKQKRYIPQQFGVILVKGSDGYFNAFPRRKRERYQNTIMPNRKTGLRIVMADDSFATRLCQFNNKRQEHPDRKCTDEDISAIRQSLTVHHVGVPLRGSMIIFKFTFSTLNRVEHYGTSRFDYNEKEGWHVDKSSSVYIK